MEDEIGSHGNATKVRSLDELDPEIQTIVLLSDAYGAEGELGIVLSEKFMEHDAYCMFDALMNGAHGAVAMADFFSPSPVGGSHSGLPPVIEASAALYHLLSVVDSSLHSHLVELGVEPQYFALRWLRVLFGREFSLENLLLIWDEIFAADKNKLEKGAEDDTGSTFGKAKSLQPLALGPSISSSSPRCGGAYNHSKSMVVRSHTLPSDSISPKTPLNMVPDSYWEEKWRVLHKAAEQRNAKAGCGNDHKPSVRRRLLEDLSQELGLDEDTEKAGCDEVSGQKDHICKVVEVENQDGVNNDFTCVAEERCLSGIAGSEENSSVFSDPSSPLSGANNHENDSEKSSVASNSSIDETDDHPEANHEDTTLPVSHLPNNATLNSGDNNEATGKSLAVPKERKLLSGKFQWFWKFGRSNDGEETSEKGNGALDATKSANDAGSQSSTVCSSVDGSCYSSATGDLVDQNMMGSLRNLGHSMLEHIQVIESVFQQDRVQVGSSDNFSKNVLVGKGQVTAMTALKELRKISNLLSEM
ncbi:hypothetical protein GH714_004972 [Hevea brasiliensis]|uniref:Rab-GAP TBC domain-containing protein n=1 Tax=Hevea brasiliensis TaxID=3981 RepID=A0A6A6MB86_HEVBR|nr:hypothetical protein GH714_004972 [Hevea brasiliensis]